MDFQKKHTVRAINFMLLWCFIIGIVTYPDIPITIELLPCGLLYYVYIIGAAAREREQAYPQLSIQERTMYMYAVIGLSPRAMSVLLGMNIENVYNRKSRLKAKLRAGSAEFVDALNA